MNKKKQPIGNNLQIDDFLKILKGLESTRDKLLLQTLFETGCSIKEVCTLKIGEIQLPQSIFQNNLITFHDPQRKSVISSTLAQDLHAYILLRKRNPTQYLYAQQPHKPFSVKRIEQIVTKISTEAHITFSPQDIRYLHIRHAATKGLTPDSIAAHTGLSRQRILQILDGTGIAYLQSYSLFFEDLKIRRNQP